jgi:glycosyltransferase involved in cell wall biosynthesis
VPNATLHVYYGFLNWKAASHAAGNEAQLREIAHLEHLSRTMPGIIFHDRINQNELAREFMRSGVWAYPTWFTETNCITAAEAQAAGLHIVTSKLAALQTTVADRGVLLDWERVAGDMNRLPLPEYRARFIEHTTRFMLQPDEAERQRVRKYALEYFALDSLADEWDQMLTEIVAEMTERVVPRFYDAEVAA